MKDEKFKKPMFGVRLSLSKPCRSLDNIMLIA
jgi:hypothetical protein